MCEKSEFVSVVSSWEVDMRRAVAVEGHVLCFCYCQYIAYISAPTDPRVRHVNDESIVKIFDSLTGMEL